MTPAAPQRLAAFALLVWFAVAVALTALYGHFAEDDLFITYRYTENLASGRGFVFNPGERVLGLTEPAQGVLLAALRFVTRVPVPWLGTVVTALGLPAVAAVMRREAAKAGLPWTGLVGGTLVVGLTFFWGCRGTGVIPGLALLAWAASVAAERPVMAGLAAGAAVWFRPELGLGVGILVLLLAWERRRWPWRFASAAVGVMSAGALACGLYFGRVLPITLGAKQSFAAWSPAARSSGASFWPSFVPSLELHFGGLWWPVLVLAVVGMIWGLGRDGALREIGRHGVRPLRVLMGLGLGLVVAYPMLGVPLFGWYAIPCLVAMIYGFALLLDLAASRLRPPLAVGVFLALLALTWPSWRNLGQALLKPGTSPRFVAYREAGRWIREHSRPEERVAALEVGTLGYFAERPVTDLLGLVSPEVAESVRTGDVMAGLEARPTELFVLTRALEGLTGPVESRPWFTETYERVHTLPGEDEVRIYRQRQVADRALGAAPIF